MGNDIPTRQNALIELVRASREADHRAKVTGGLQLTLSLLSAVVGPAIAWIVSHYHPVAGPDAKAWAGAFAILAILVDVVFFEPRVARLRQIKARIQEQFDTDVYDLPWNQVKAGPRINAGEIKSLAKEHQRRIADDTEFLNWYPACVGEVPISYARLICQASSMRWDSSLRGVFCLLYAIGLVILLVGGSAYALAAHFDMQSFVLSVLMPLLPAALQLWRERKKNADAAADMERATQHVDALFEGLLTGHVSNDEAKVQARLLQDELYDRRRRAPAIPEQVYQFTRTDNEERMIAVAQEQVDRVKHKLNSSP